MGSPPAFNGKRAKRAGTIRIWDGTPLRGDEHGQEALTFAEHTDEIRSVAFRPEGAGASGENEADEGPVVASAGHEGLVKIWDAASGSQMLQIPLQSAGTALGFSPDGSRLIVGDAGGNILIFDIGSLKARTGYREFPELVHKAVFDPSGKWLFANSDARKVWMFNAAALAKG